MAKVEYLTTQSVLSLISPRGLYVVAYSWLFGMSLWVTFFGGVIAFKALPRQQFGTLQHKTFPIYFGISIFLSGSMLGYWVFTHPDVASYLAHPTMADVAQAYALFAVFGGQSFNKFVIGPLTSETMFRRHRLEKEEGKNYNDPGVSPAMKSLNRRFGMLHGISSLANLIAVISLGFHGLWIGHTGVGGY
ncbi:hypothetical protein AMATHDRAFT_154267 [Amanita thiersii Skay4041]|uniref:TMEM205-like domain-containing protein n=1 Tax=Amanita thiersii Skay4041 TaxID=703135 RepID=A0A2A9NG10_9AGAR|nr:hypothetical protein AMATHDRAFT_154267 [Amanita thiersii Skay4041]